MKSLGPATKKLCLFTGVPEESSERPTAS
jgi:hypothetical protein